MLDARCSMLDVGSTHSEGPEMPHRRGRRTLPLVAAICACRRTPSLSLQTGNGYGYGYDSGTETETGTETGVGNRIQ
jgi:hypothetical protein